MTTTQVLSTVAPPGRQVPHTMCAIRCVGPKVAKECVVPVPTAGRGQVLVRVHTAAVNPVDCKVFSTFGGLEVEGFTLGCDLAGVVMAVGQGVTRLNVGDEVFGVSTAIGYGHGGSFADYCIAWEDLLVRKPQALSMRQAAAAPHALLGVWDALVRRVKVKPGDHVLVIGGGGAVGLLCLQMAVLGKAALVMGTDSEAKRGLIEQRGGVWVNRNVDGSALAAMAKQRTPNGRGFDIICDSVGGTYYTTALNLLAPHGTLVAFNTYEHQPLTPAALKGASIVFPAASLACVYAEPLVRRYMGDMLREAASYLAWGKLHVDVDDTVLVPFTATGVLVAFSTQMQYRNRGKIVLDVLQKQQKSR